MNASVVEACQSKDGSDAAILVKLEVEGRHIEGRRDVIRHCGILLHPFSSMIARILNDVEKPPPPPPQPAATRSPP